MTVDRPALPEQVRVGARVEIELIDENGGREPLVVEIVREQFADLDRGLLGVQTPLAKALLAKRAGVTVPYRMGDIRQVAIVRVTPAQPRELADTAEHRQQTLQSALHKVERTNAEMFAASYSGKWGDYQLNDNPVDNKTLRDQTESTTDQSHE